MVAECNREMSVVVRVGARMRHVRASDHILTIYQEALKFDRGKTVQSGNFENMGREYGVRNVPPA